MNELQEARVGRAPGHPLCVLEQPLRAAPRAVQGAMGALAGFQGQRPRQLLRSAFTKRGLQMRRLHALAQQGVSQDEAESRRVQRIDPSPTGF